jgi:hypothetical protein
MKERTSAPVPDSPEYYDWLHREDPELDRADRAYFRNGYVDRTERYRNDEDGRFWGY